MIKLYYWPTPNGHKITVFLEEAGIPYEVMPIDIGKGDQFSEKFLSISPNNRMPAIEDTEPADGGEPLALFESGVILHYLAEKYNRFILKTERGKYECLQWLHWQIGGLGPMLGQNHHFSVYAPEKIPYAVNRYVNETSRLYQVLDNRLKSRDFICGEYTIVDMACYPWIVPYERQQQNISDFTHVEKWFNRILNRPAVIKAYELGEQYRSGSTINEETAKVLFGQNADTLKFK